MPPSNPQENKSSFGSMVFCQRCGNLLASIGQEGSVTCEVCSLTHTADAFEHFKVVTQSARGAFPSILKSKRGLVQKRGADREKAATIDEKCPSCGNPQMSFHTMQLRSADEGQTIFYNCNKCGHKFSINS